MKNELIKQNEADLEEILSSIGKAENTNPPFRKIFDGML